MIEECEEIVTQLLSQAASQVSRNFGTDYRETLQEAWLWALEEDKAGERRFDKLTGWVADGKRKQAFLAVAEGIGRNGYGRREKALRLGLKPTDLDRRKVKDPDQFNYSTALVDELIPMASNPDWRPGDDQVAESNSNTKRTKKAPGEWGNAMAMVCDVRRAQKAGHYTADAIAAFLNGDAA